MPTKKMILTQNLVLNLPTCVVMTLTAALASGAGLNIGTIIQFFIGFVVIEILGAVIPVKKIAGGIGAKFFPGKNVRRGRDDTLFTVADGTVKFEKDGRSVSVVPVEA